MSQEATQNAAETEIEPLSDEALEDAAGGAQDLCSFISCSPVP